LQALDTLADTEFDTAAAAATAEDTAAGT
jgi:hypothetical protein